MKDHAGQRWILGTVGGLIGLVWLGGGLAQAGTIAPIDPATHNPIAVTATTPTLSIIRVSDSFDLTDTWLPEPGQNVKIVVKVNGVDQTASATVRLVAPPAVVLTNGTINESGLPLPYNFDGMSNPFLTATLVTTSAYPGVCTNSPSLASNAAKPGNYFAADFTFDASTKILSPTDCGGMAVFKVTYNSQNYYYIAPADSDHDGIPDIFEAMYGPAFGAGSLDPNADHDIGGVNNPNLGDGVAAFDEYRGFMVSGVHQRTDPTKKDFYLQFDTSNPQCTTVVGTTEGPRLFAAAGQPNPNNISGNPIRVATYFPSGAAAFATDQPDLFFNLNSLASLNAVAIHRILSTEFVNHFVKYSASATDPVSYLAGSDLGVSDRQINQNAVYTKLEPPRTTPIIQKAIRFIDCVDLFVTQRIYGIASFGSPDLQGLGDGNAVLFSQRIAHNVNCLVSFVDSVSCLTVVGGGVRTLRYQTFPGVSGDIDASGSGWTAAKTTFIDATTNTSKPVDRNYLIMHVMQFFFAMEVTHGMNLLDQTLNSCGSTCGVHFPELTGDTLDQYVTNRLDTCPRSGCRANIQFNTFRIPKLFGSTDLANFKVKD